MFDVNRWAAKVVTHSSVDEREMNSSVAFVDFVGLHEDPACITDEHHAPEHVTASAIVVSDAGDKVALHLHKRLGIWLQPGGHVEAGETVEEAALREAREEIGVPVRHHADGGLFVHIDVHPGPKGHTHFDLRFLLRAPEVTPDPADGESREVRWFGWDEAMAVADGGLVGALRRVRSLLGG